jgi:predicted nucleic acid-binding protein
MTSLLPVPSSIYERAVLFDSSAFVSIIDRNDRNHVSAKECLVELRRLKYPLYVTTLTISESHRRILQIGNIDRTEIVSFLEGIYDGSFNIIRPTIEDDLRAIGYIRRFADQLLTLTDTVSMAVMARLGLRKVFAYDWHFGILGFQIIPPLIEWTTQ